MKKVFKCLLILLALSLCLLSLVGCGDEKKSIDLGDGGEVEVGTNEVKLKDNEGNEVIIGDNWPDSEWAKIIPEFTKGKIASSMDMAEGLVLTINEVEKDDFDGYSPEIKASFPDGDELETDGLFSYSGANDNGEKVTLLYYKTDEALMITVEKE